MAVIFSGYGYVEETITYNCNVTNAARLDILWKSSITDNKIIQISVQNGDFGPGKRVIIISTYSITQADLDACSVTNSVYATNNNIKSNVVSETIHTDDCYR